MIQSEDCLVVQAIGYSFDEVREVLPQSDAEGVHRCHGLRVISDGDSCVFAIIVRYPARVGLPGSAWIEGRLSALEDYTEERFLMVAEMRGFVQPPHISIDEMTALEAMWAGARSAQLQLETCGDDAVMLYEHYMGQFEDMYMGYLRRSEDATR